jgi:Polyketide cyclase / dehydrase and lipid transport
VQQGFVSDTGPTSDEALTFSSSIEIARASELVYDLIADITRMGEWSPVCTGGRWVDGSGPDPGNWFIGFNTHNGRSWQTRSKVETAKRGQAFAFVVGGDSVRWAYKFSAVPDGTTVTESWSLLPAGVAVFEAKYGDAAADIIADRRQAARWSIPLTLAALKSAAEAL